MLCQRDTIAIVAWTAQLLEDLQTTYDVRSQVDHPEDIVVCPTTGYEHIRHVFPTVEQRGIAVWLQSNQELPTTIVP